MSDEHLITRLLTLGEGARRDDSDRRDETDRRDGAVIASPFVAQVVARVSPMPSPIAVRRTQRRRRAAGVAIGLAAAVTLAVPGPRAAVARWLGVGAVRIDRVSGPVRPGVPPSLAGLDLGGPVTSAEASAGLGHRVASIPRRRPIGRFIQFLGGGGRGPVAVNTLYDGTGDGKSTTVLVTELGNGHGIYVDKKVIAAGTELEFFDLEHGDAIWVSGAPHEVAMGDGRGARVVVPVRLAGNVLVWADATRTLRVEGVESKEDAIAILRLLVSP